MLANFFSRLLQKAVAHGIIYSQTFSVIMQKERIKIMKPTTIKLILIETSGADTVYEGSAKVTELP